MSRRGGVKSVFGARSASRAFLPPLLPPFLLRPRLPPPLAVAAAFPLRSRGREFCRTQREREEIPGPSSSSSPFSFSLSPSFPPIAISVRRKGGNKSQGWAFDARRGGGGGRRRRRRRRELQKSANKRGAPQPYKAGGEEQKRDSFPSVKAYHYGCAL